MLCIGRKKWFLDKRDDFSVSTLNIDQGFDKGSPYVVCFPW